SKTGGIAIGLEFTGPMPVGTAKKDRSLLGCNDMSGNGWEWTRAYSADSPGELSGDWTHTPQAAKVILRGRDYARPEPLTFEYIATTPISCSAFDNEYRTDEERTSMLPHIGFRIVVLPRRLTDS